MKREKLEREFGGEDAILDSGSNKRELFVVRSGNVMLVPNDGSEQRLLGPGEIFGELGAIVGEPRTNRNNNRNNRTNHRTNRNNN